MYLAAELSALGAGVARTIVAGLSGLGVTLKDMAISAGRVDGLITTELGLVADAEALAGFA